MRYCCLALFLLVTVLLPAQRTTLLDKNGEVMRGTPVALGRNNALGATRAAVNDLSWWEAVDTLELNTVRLCWVDPWYDRHDFGTPWTVDEALIRIDQAVANATATGLNLIINYHNVNEYGETGGFGRMTEFWTKVAPRYADNDLVYYELNNEQAFEAAPYRDPAFQDTMRRVYELVHEAAPERHIILFSFNSLNLPLLSLVEEYDWVDYNYTTVGFHMYGWFQVPVSTGENNLEAIIEAGYPLICTEWDVRQSLNYVSPFYGQQVMAQPLERLGISWVDWRDWGDATNDHVTDVIIPDALAQGYWWGAPSSVRDRQLMLPLSAYPNPVRETLQLTVPDDLTGPVTVSVFDALGRTLLTQQTVAGAGNLRLAVDGLSAGTYTARVDGDGRWGVVRFVR